MSDNEIIHAGTLMPVATRKTRTPKAPATPMGMVAMAVAQGATIDKLEKLMDLQDRWEARESLKAFNVAFADFKAEAVQIVKNVKVTDGPLKGKSYADLFGVVQAVTPALSKHGLSASWKTTKDDPNWIEVTCILRHIDGHYETESMGGIPDVGGAKNAIQARASSKSYLERYTLMAITGLASSDMDKDGHGEGVKMPEGELQTHLAKIQTASNETLKTVYQEAVASCPKGDTKTPQSFADAKNLRYRELNPKVA